MRRGGVLLLAALTAVGACSLDSTGPTPLAAVNELLPDKAPAVLVGAGDIGLCGSAAAQATSRLLDGISGTVFTAGDNAYPNGTAANFRDCYDPAWGRHKSRTRPVPGNHDYESAGAAPYFDYFGDRAGPSGLGYYSYRVGEWQVLALNSNVPTDPASPQGQWLREELTEHPSPCTLAMWHHPLFSSGPNGDNPSTRPLWQALYDRGADVVVVGHDHLYERFAPQDADGRLDPVRGIREFIAGTGGAGTTTPVRTHANSDVLWSVNGVLQLTLGAGTYTWTFLTDTGAVADTGAGTCH